MRKSMIAVVSLTLISLALSLPAARSEPVWTTPGWYQVADTIVGLFVWSGPFPDEGACRASLPPNEPDADYVCEYLTERPSWDE
jgi:hypothetical protein